MKKTRHFGIMRIGKNHYLVRVKAKCPRTGKTREVKRRVRGPIGHALKAKSSIRSDILEGGPAQRVRLADYAESWLRGRLPTIKRSTADKYASDLDLHILPALGSYYVDALRRSDIQEYVANRTGKLSGHKLVNQVRLLRTINKDAMAEGLCGHEFCARVKLPPVKKYSEDDPNLLTREELQKLVAAIPQQWKALTLLLATTGIRWGEASGLRWGDIDWDAGSIKVRRTNWKGQTHDVKTDGSVRTLPLLDDVAALLRVHRASIRSEWVFPTKTGDLHKGTPFNKVLTRACKAAGVRRIVPHGLRRTFNNIGRQVTDKVTLQAITGHVTDEMTDHYSVVSLAEKKKAAAGVLRLVSPEVEHLVEHAIH